MPNPDLSKLTSLALAIEEELKALQVWNRNPLPAGKYENMGAFGSNTMAFTQWIQFILLPVMEGIVKGERELPSNSMIAAQGVREFDGDGRYDRLSGMLRQVDDFANGEDSEHWTPPVAETNVLPEALLVIATALPGMDGDLLESNLQSYDIFMPMLPAIARDQAAALFAKARATTKNENTRARLQRAIESLRKDELICKPYNHEEEMRKYREDFKKGYPDAE